MGTKSLTSDRKSRWPDAVTAKSAAAVPLIRQIVLKAFRHKYSPSLLFFATGIFALGIVDAYWTLTLLNTGSVVELNPFMLVFIERDIHLFLLVKGVITGISVLALVACTSVPHMSRVDAKLVIQGLFFIYLTLVCYEAFLLNQLL